MDLTKLHLLTRNFIVQLNDQGIIVDLIPMEAMPLDYSSSELLQLKVSKIIHKSCIQKFNDTLSQVNSRHVKKIDILLITKFKKEEWYKLSLIRYKKSIIIYCNEIHHYKLNESNDAFKLLADKAPIPIVGLEYPSLKLNYSNKSCINELGFNYNEIQKFSQWHKRILFSNEDDKRKKGIERTQYLEDMIKGAVKNAKPLRRQLITKNGEVKRYDVSFSVLNENNLYAFFHDITDQYNAQAVLKKNQNKLQNLIENLPIAILSYDLNSNAIFANKRNRKLFGNTINKIKKIEDFANFIIPTSKEPKAQLLFKKSIEFLKQKKTNESYQLDDFEFCLMCDDKKLHTFRIKQSIIEQVLVLIFKDITEERKAYKLLEESEKNFKALAQNMPTAIGAYNINEKIIFLNKHFTKLTGYTKKDIPTLKDWYKKSQPDKQIRNELYNFWNALLKDYKEGIIKEKPVIIRKIKCKNGNFKYLNFLFSIVEDTFYVQAIDVTGETFAKQELEQSHQQLRSLAESLQDEIEKERKHISSEIHDELGQQITSIKMQLGNLWKKTGQENYDQDYKNILKSIDNSIKTVRNISTKLRPSILDDLGLIAALEWQIKEFCKSTNTKVVFKHTIDEAELDKSTQLHFFRILQESLTNINRHANATKVSVNLNATKEQICLSIKDNGNGFNINQPTKSMGILLMKERALAINGSFNIKSKIKVGTTIKICLPRIKL